MQAIIPASRDSSRVRAEQGSAEPAQAGGERGAGQAPRKLAAGHCVCARAKRATYPAHSSGMAESTRGMTKRRRSAAEIADEIRASDLEADSG